MEKITKTYGFKLDSQPIYDKNYTKTKLKTYDDKFNTILTDNENPKEKTHYSCIAAICGVSILKLNEQNYPQLHLEQCKCS